MSSCGKCMLTMRGNAVRVHEILGRYVPEMGTFCDSCRTLDVNEHDALYLFMCGNRFPPIRARTPQCDSFLRIRQDLHMSPDIKWAYIIRRFCSKSSVCEAHTVTP